MQTRLDKQKIKKNRMAYKQADLLIRVGKKYEEKEGGEGGGRRGRRGEGVKRTDLDMSSYVPRFSSFVLFDLFYSLFSSVFALQVALIVVCLDGPCWFTL